jgi:Flp pilus assembly protein CpaB
VGGVEGGICGGRLHRGAARLGRLSLAIRSAADDEKTEGSHAVTNADVSSVRPAAAIPVGTRVQVIHGDQRNEVNFK